MPICALADVKLRLGISDTTDDALLNELIAQVGDDFQRQSGQSFVGDTANTDYYFDVPPWLHLSLQLPVPGGIQSIATLEYATATQPASGGTYTVIPAANYVFRPLVQERVAMNWPADRVMILDTDHVSRFYQGSNTVHLNGKLGWAAVPAGIDNIAQALVVRRYQMRKSGQSDLVGSSDFGTRLYRFLLPEERDVLDQYSLPGIA